MTTESNAAPMTSSPFRRLRRNQSELAEIKQNKTTNENALFVLIENIPRPLPKIIWAAAVNLSGLFCLVPMKCSLLPNLLFDPKAFYSCDKDFVLEALGLYKNDGYIVYASVNKEDVQNWILGARCTLTMIHSWSRYGDMNKLDIMK